jgi:hypothetical protein
MIDQLLAQAEADLEIAIKRREIAAALAADWSYWAPLLNGSQGAAQTHEATAQPPAPVLAASEAPRSCRQCSALFTPLRNGQGQPQVYCSPACRAKYHHPQTGRPRGRPRKEAKLEPEPLPDQVERPFSMAEAEAVWLKEQLRPPHLAVEEPLR